MEEVKRVHKDGKRFYQVTKDGKVIATLPSVTTIQGEMSDKSGLEKWKKRVGEAEANRISQLSMNRGTIMHRQIELYKSYEGTPEEMKEQLSEACKIDEEINEVVQKENGNLYLEEAWKMFDKFYYNQSRFFSRIDEVLDAERFLWTLKGGEYAGTLDNVSRMKDGSVQIIDYKNSRKPKRLDWITGYFQQTAAYWVAYWDRTGIKADGAEIWIANEVDDMPQCFTLDKQDLEDHYKSFIEIRKAFKNKFGY